MGRFSMRGAAQPAAAVSARPRFPAMTKALSRRRKLELCAISSMPSYASSTEQLLAKRPGYQTSQIKWSWLKAWAMKIAKHRGLKKAIVALARRLAVIMHRIWVDGTEFRWTREVTAT
jgi:hypothetical protein